MNAWVIVIVGMLTVYLGLITLQLLLSLISNYYKKLDSKKTAVSDNTDESYAAACIALAMHISHKVEYKDFLPANMTNWQIIKDGL